MNRPHRRRRLKRWLSAWPAILMLSAVAVIDHYGVFEVSDGWLLDSQFSLLRAIRPAVVDSRVVVIAVDEATFKASKTPMALWHPHYGQLFEWLATAQPLAVGFDVVLPARGYEQRFPGTDQSLMRGLQALREAGIPVIVAHSIDEQRKPRSIYAPFLSLVDPRYGVGSDVLIPDADRVVRRHTEVLGIDGGVIPTFAGQVVRAVGGHYAQGLLNYRIIQDIPVISAQTLFDDSWERQKLQEVLKDKIIVIGSVLSDIDRLALPFPLLRSESASRQPGVIVQANIISAVLNQSLLPEPKRWPVIPLLALTLVLWPMSTTVFRASAGFCLFGIGIYSLTLSLLMQGWYLSIAAALASALMLAVTRVLISTYRAQKAVLIANTRVEAQKEFVNAISHDLRTPVGAMLSTVDLVKTSKDDQTRNRYLAWLSQAATILEHEVDELLALSKIEDTAYQPAQVTFNLYAVLAELYASILPLAAAKKLTATLSISANLAPIRRGSQTSVARLLQNLLSNALKYSNRGCISLRVSPGVEEQCVQFEVEDEGGGIPKDQIAHLFDKYQRFNDEQPGVGLGMAIVRKLVDVLDGTISIDTTEGRGTTIRIALPLDEKPVDCEALAPALPPIVADIQDVGVIRALETAEVDLRKQDSARQATHWVEITDQDHMAGPHVRSIKVLPDRAGLASTADDVWHFGCGAYVSRPVSAITLQRCLRLAALDFELTSSVKSEATRNKNASGREHRNVLLVDDNEIVRMVWTELLAKAGYNVVTASCGTETIAQLKKTRFDIVILDQNMPDVLGTELAKDIRQMEGVDPYLRILLTTAETFDESDTLPAAITQRLPKTIAPDNLRDMIDGVINRDPGCGCNKYADSG